LQLLTDKVATLANVAAILRGFSADRLELSVTEVSRLLGIPKSSASRLLTSMRAEGLLVKANDSLRYRIGPLLFEVARLHRSSSTLIEQADQQLAGVCKETGHTGYVSILDQSDVLVIRVHPGRSVLRVVTALGHRAPAFATATGRTLLARLTDDQVAKLHPDGLSPPSESAPRTLPELLEALQGVRRRGWAEAIDEAVPGVDSIAVAVADLENAEMLSFCLTFPPSQVGKEDKERILELLINAARVIATKVDDPVWLPLSKTAKVAGIR
jgi:IclR family KDG regulon transcriptional repressor